MIWPQSCTSLPLTWWIRMAHARKGHVALGGVTDEILLTTDGLDEMGAVGRFPDEEMQDGRAWGRHAVAVPAPQHPSCNTLTHTGCLDRSFSELGEKREADEPAEMMLQLETGELGSHYRNTQQHEESGQQLHGRWSVCRGDWAAGDGVAVRLDCVRSPTFGTHSSAAVAWPAPTLTSVAT